MGRLSSAVTLLAALSIQPSALSGQSEALEANPAEQYLQQAADQERAGLNLPPLRRDPALAVAARQHALQMLEHNTISHQFAHEPDLAQRGAAAGARFSLISENVAESPSALKIHTAWMHSEGHRHNLLDSRVDSVGIAVVARGRQLFAVEDFERTLAPMTLQQQENSVGAVIGKSNVAVLQSDSTARKTCSRETGTPAGIRPPAFVMRYTTSDVGRLPEELQSRLATGKYTSAVVGACPADDGGSFSMYRIAVLLYR